MLVPGREPTDNKDTNCNPKDRTEGTSAEAQKVAPAGEVLVEPTLTTGDTSVIEAGGQQCEIDQNSIEMADKLSENSNKGEHVTCDIVETEKDEVIGVMQDSHPVSVGLGMDVVEELGEVNPDQAFFKKPTKRKKKSLRTSKKVRNEID